MNETKPGAAPLRILVADDDPRIRELLKSVLEVFGYATVCVNNGLEAVRAFEKNDSFDLIILDIRMPVMDGLNASREIRLCGRAGARVPIIALTAHNTTVAKAHCLAVSMDGFLVKPVDTKSLYEAIQRNIRIAITRAPYLPPAVAPPVLPGAAKRDAGPVDLYEAIINIHDVLGEILSYSMETQAQIIESQESVLYSTNELLNIVDPGVGVELCEIIDKEASRTMSTCSGSEHMHAQIRNLLQKLGAMEKELALGLDEDVLRKRGAASENTQDDIDAILNA